MKRPTITLREEDHTYHLSDGRTAQISSTGLIDLYCEEFNAEDALDKKGVTNPFERERLKFEWDMSSHQGRFKHLIAEKISLGLIKKQHILDVLGSIPKEIEFIVEYIKSIDTDEWERIPEYTIYYEKDGVVVGGQTDMLLKSKTRKSVYRLDDYKFTKNLDTKAYGKTMYPPISKLPASKVNKYSLQNSLYKIMILQEDPDATFDDGFLVHIRPPIENGFTKEKMPPKMTLIPCKDLMKEAQAILDHYITSHSQP